MTLRKRPSLRSADGLFWGEQFHKGTVVIHRFLSRPLSLARSADFHQKNKNKVVTGLHERTITQLLVFDANRERVYRFTGASAFTTSGV